MNQKNIKSKKPKLKIDASELVGKLEDLLKEGMSMQDQSEIDERAYENWFDKVMNILRMSFVNENNEFANRFLPPPVFLESAQIDLNSRIKSDLANEVSQLYIIKGDIATRYL